jgi:crossover junction endodeoxyribonuclease RuvC
VRTALSVGQARRGSTGAGRTTYRFEQYAHLEVKQAVVGYGGADKRQVQLMVRALLDLPEVPEPDDAAGALVAICHVHSAKLRPVSQRPGCRMRPGSFYGKR